jgi:Predicted protease with the C-terminal PDZ domain
MRLSIISFVLCFTISFSFSQNKQKSYEYTVDLTKVQDDRLFVQLSVPAVSGDEITFYMPKIIPGTYAIADYGRYVQEFKALDKKGKPLPVEKVDENTWKIQSASKLAKITYWVDDTFDTETSGPEIFWPAGTNIEDATNYVINASGFFGYFDDMKNIPFKVNVVRSENLYGSTGLIPLQTGAPTKILKLEKSSSTMPQVVDVFRTENYDELVDSPIMYAQPDTAIIRVANTEVLIGSYSPNKKVTAKEIAESIREVLQAQTAYLGGKLPVDKYAFIFYFTDQPVMSYGALEHSYSSFYYMPEMPISEMNQQLRDFAAHEFFHIVTPLTVHSEHIENFDFNDPKMSKHLWMYEGVTEYFAANVQVQHGLISPDEYLNVLYEKMHTADQFLDDVPFTEISQFTLDKYHDQYYNVYQKGALIGMCIDIKLLSLSKGQYDLRKLMLDLSKKFGKTKAFKDDELFDVITEMTYPEIGEFFTRYVAGNEPLPLEDVFKDVGVIYKDGEVFEDYSLGITNADVGITEVDSKPRLQIISTDQQNEMGKAIGFFEGDILIGINDEEMPDLGPELGVFIQKQIQALPESDTLSYTVLRKDASGEIQKIRLAAPVKKIQMTRRHMLMPDPEVTEEQLRTRNAWLGIDS